ncbi:MAG TPA: hypothetical protein VK102_12100 [Sphingobacterium sp.]|nr:hypothetical protein [Sphingobacterium sp.]
MAKDFKSAIQKTNLGEKGGITSLVEGSRDSNIGNTVLQSNTGNTGNKDTRQTFILSVKSLEKLKDFVHYRRLQGQTNYTQKQALQEALRLLFETVPQLPERPK